MEKRAVAPLVLAGAGLTLAIAVVVLMVKVRAGAPEPSVGPAELSRAGSRLPPATRGGAGEADETPPAVTPRLQPPPDEPSPPVAEQGTGAPPISMGGIGDSAASIPAPATLAEKMVEANRLYDRGDYEAANKMADEALKDEPQNVKMLRIGASSACILGDPAAARVHYDKLPERDQQQIARRCKRYGVEF